MVYDKCDSVTRAGLDVSRNTEWQKWLDFNAGKVIRGDLLKELIAEDDEFPDDEEGAKLEEVVEEQFVEEEAVEESVEESAQVVA